MHITTHRTCLRFHMHWKNSYFLPFSVRLGMTQLSILIFFSLESLFSNLRRSTLVHELSEVRILNLVSRIGERKWGGRELWYNCSKLETIYLNLPPMDLWQMGFGWWVFDEFVLVNALQWMAFGQWICDIWVLANKSFGDHQLVFGKWIFDHWQLVIRSLVIGNFFRTAIGYFLEWPLVISHQPLTIRMGHWSLAIGNSFG